MFGVLNEESAEEVKVVVVQPVNYADACEGLAEELISYARTAFHAYCNIGFRPASPRLPDK